MSPPDKSPTDDKVKRLRERALDLLADAAVHTQRLDGVAQKLGLTAGVADGLGDSLYEAVVAQLDVAAKVLERSQLLADRLFDLGAQRVDGGRFARVDVKAGKRAQFDFVIRNPSNQVADVEVEVEAAGCAPAVRVGQPRLPGGRDTTVEVGLATKKADADHVFAMVVRVHLTYEGKRRVELPVREREIWVRT